MTSIRLHMPASESDELHAVLSVHSVPQRDSRSSLTFGLESLDARLDFVMIAWTAFKAPSIAEIVLAASALEQSLEILLVGIGIRDCEAVPSAGELGLLPGWTDGTWDRLVLLIACGFGGGTGEASRGERLNMLGTQEEAQ